MAEIVNNCLPRAKKTTKLLLRIVMYVLKKLFYLVLSRYNIKLFFVFDLMCNSFVLKLNVIAMKRI